ncbi:MAG: hypothetical protein ACFE9Z_14985 [Promethearchaeota archaeon]
MSKTVMLVFAIILIVVGAFFLGFWTLVLLIDISLRQQYPGVQMSPEGVISFYTFLTVGIVAVVVSITLFIIRAKTS